MITARHRRDLGRSWRLASHAWMHADSTPRCRIRSRPAIGAARLVRRRCATTRRSSNALSLLFPEGETLLRRIGEAAAGQDHRSRARCAEIIGFIGQEAMHGKEHRAFNELLVAHGYAEAPRVDAGLRNFLKRVRKVLSPMSQLAVTCALEHFTAMLAEAAARATSGCAARSTRACARCGCGTRSRRASTRRSRSTSTTRPAAATRGASRSCC